MSIILVLIPLSILFAVAFFAAFIWAVRSGQYEDTCTPSMRLLLDDPGGMTGSKGGPPSPRPSPPGEGARSGSQDVITSSAAPLNAKDVGGIAGDFNALVTPPLLGGEGRGEGEC